MRNEKPENHRIRRIENGTPRRKGASELDDEKKREQKGKKVRMNQSGEDEIIREFTNVK